MVRCRHAFLAAVFATVFTTLFATVSTTGCGVSSVKRGKGARQPPPDQGQTRTQELIERVARLELGIRRHRELAAARDKSLATELEKILSGIVRLTSPGAKTSVPSTRLLPDVVYSVPIDGSPVEGPADAPVTLVVATDFTCPFCEALETTLEGLRAEYKGKLRVVRQSSFNNRKLARNAALAYCAANRQNRGESMRGELWREHRVGIADGTLDSRLTGAKLADLAVALGARRKRFETDVQSYCATQIDVEIARFEKLGVDGAPTIFINGRVVAGAQRMDTYRALIDAALIRAKRARAAGVKMRHYYDVIVATGSERATPVAP